METNDKIRQYLKNQMPDEYRRLLKLEEANREAMQLPKDSIIIRVEAMDRMERSHWYRGKKDNKTIPPILKTAA